LTNFDEAVKQVECQAQKIDKLKDIANVVPKDEFNLAQVQLNALKNEMMKMQTDKIKETKENKLLQANLSDNSE